MQLGRELEIHHSSERESPKSGQCQDGKASSQPLLSTNALNVERSSQPDEGAVSEQQMQKENVCSEPAQTTKERARLDHHLCEARCTTPEVRVQNEGVADSEAPIGIGTGAGEQMLHAVK